MNVELVIGNGPGKGKAIRLRSEETIVGRRMGCDLRIPAAAVSRRHCRLSILDKVLMVEDLDSINGTYVNGERIHETRVLQPGDRLQVGPVTFLVKYARSQAAAAEEESIVTVEAVGRVSSDGLPVFDPDELEALHEDARATTPRPAKPTAVNDKKTKTPAAKPAPEKKPPPPKKPEPEPEEAGVEFLDESTWHIPAEGDLRDFLADIDKPDDKVD
jgi:pSer/pThr/pTyr-binding forkhead associated (FHA) protein